MAAPKIPLELLKNAQDFDFYTLNCNHCAKTVTLNAPVHADDFGRRHFKIFLQVQKYLQEVQLSIAIF